MAAAPQLKTGLQFKIQIQRGPLAGQSFSFNKAVVEIGRGADNDLILSNDLRASRKHAEIRWDGHELSIVNLSTKSFVAVNGNQIDGAKLETGSIIHIGETEFRIDFHPPMATPSMTVPPGSQELEDPKTKIHFEPEAVIVQMPVLQPTRPNPVQQSPMSPMPPTPGVLGGAAGGYPNYGTNLPGSLGQPSPRPRRRRRVVSGGDSGRMRFYVIVAVIGFFFYWMMTSTPAKKKELTFRSTEQIEKDIETSKEDLKEFEARRDRLDNVQYRRAQENYIRGFRDYKQGNYSRARESFQVVLNLDPENELAKRYYQLAKLKFDETVKAHMLQGNRYREKKNWRMCASSYFNVMTMVANNQDPIFKEAKQYYNECILAQTGRY
jgi:FHA domain-containing protein